MDDASGARIDGLEEKYRELEKKYRFLTRQYEIAKITIDRSKMYISSKDKLLAAIVDEKAKQDKYFSLLLENTQEIMLLLDQKLRFVYCSDMFLRQAGIANFSLIRDQKFQQVFRQAVDKDSLAYLTKILEGAIENCWVNVVNQVMDIGIWGKPRHYTVYINPMMNEKGVPEGVLVLFQDVTEVLAAKEQAEQANRAKSAFLARMSHEIRTPLNAILGLSEVELQNNLSDRTRINLEKIYGSGSHLLEIINDILDISKIESGNFEITPAEYELSGLVNDAVQLNIVRIGSKPIKFTLDLDETIPVKLYGDELRVKQILHNLLSNAFKYTEKGEVRLRIKWEDRGGAAWITYTVEDTGRGIRAEDMEKLFSEYTQFDTAANRRIEGTGLGLSITKGLVDMMGGAITAESEYGRGSVFRVSLPQGIVDKRPIGAELAERLRDFRFIEDRGRSRGNSLIRSYMPYGKILVVDDLPTNLDVMTGLLTPYGLRVDAVASGREAVERIRSEEIRYDLVFMDHMMPEMDGIEAARIIRNEIGTAYARRVPIIVLTANAIEGNRELFLRSGFNDFISKPIDIKRLDMALNQWIRDKQSEETLKEAEHQAQERMEIPEQAEFGGGSTDPEGRWLLDHPVEGVDFARALILYGNRGAAFFPILKSFVTYTPVLLEKMSAHLESSSPDYAIEVHGLKGTCNAVCADGTATLARELEFAAKKGDFDLVRSRHGELKQKTLDLTARISGLLGEWESVHSLGDREQRPEPDPALLARLSEATAAFNSNATEEVLEELEQYHYKKGEELIRWLREQAENFDYDAIHRRLEELPGSAR
jgi:signal transduction histidine kinase/CheY-like chemotaxis protein